MREGSVIGTASTVACIPFARVRALITPDGAPTLLEVRDRTDGLIIGVEPDEAMVWMHGGYWYQGEYLFGSHPNGTQVTYRIRNISGHPDIVIRLWQRRALKNQQAELEHYVAALKHRV